MVQARIQRFERGKTFTLDEIKQKMEESPFDSYMEALIKLLEKLEDNHKAYYAGMGWERDYEQKRGVTFGDKWDKVWVLTDNKKARIVCHIDSNTGIIYKSNGYQGAPYPKPRADIYEPESYEYADPHGGWLYADFKPNQPSTQTQRSRGTNIKQILEKGQAIMTDR